MQAICLAAMLGIASSPTARAGSPRAHDPEVAARVNGVAVTRADVERFMADRLRRTQLEHLAVARTEDAPLAELALREMVHRELLLQEARRRKLVVSRDETDQAVTALRRRFGDLESFGMWMAERNLDDRSLIASLQAQMLIARATAALVADVRVADRAVREYYERNVSKLVTEDLWLQVIVVKTRESGEAIQAALARGEDFGGLARRHSLGRQAGRGGDLGWVSSQSLRSPLREAVVGLEPGKAIGPVPRTDDEFLIVRLHERRAGRRKTFDEARQGIERILLGVEQHTLLQRWLAAQEKKSNIELVAARG